MNKKTSTKKTAKKQPQAGTSLVSENTTLTLTLAKKEVAAAYQKTLQELAKNVAAAGFRKGKVPLKVAEEKLGKAKVTEHTLQALLPAAYRKAVKKSGKTPITQPEFSIVSTESGEDWTIKAFFAEMPTIKLDSYQKHVKTGLKSAKKALVEQKKAAKNSKTTKKQKGDSPQKATPPTEEQEKEINLQHIFRELVTQIKPQIPELLLKHETQHEFEHLAGQLKQLNISVDDYLQKRGMDMEQLSQELAVSTLNRLQLDVVLGAIAREKNLTVTDKDREEYFQKIPDEKQREQLKKDDHYLSHLDTNLTKQKVVDHLLSL